MITYRATGIVLGNCWGGGVCGYAAHEINANSLRELRDEIKEQLDSGSLNSGMGFESLIGAVMTIETIDIRKINNKTFIANEYETEMFGDLTEKQQDFLLEAQLYS